MTKVSSPAVRPDTGARVLDAAERLAIRRGVKELTLAAVAKSARVSKGGLLYHFPSKDALLTAMVARMVARFDAEIQTALKREPADSPGRRTRALLDGFFGVPAAEMAARNQTCSALLAAVASNPRLLDPVRAWYGRWRQGMASDRLAPERSLLALAAVDGLMFWRLFEMWTPAPRDVASVHDLLRDLCAPTYSRPSRSPSRRPTDFVKPTRALPRRNPHRK